MNIYAHHSVFDEERKYPKPRNYGKRWLAEETHTLIRAFLSGQSVQTTAQSLGRTAYNICLKLHWRDYLTCRSDGTFLYKQQIIEDPSSIMKEYTSPLKSYPNYSESQTTQQKETMKILEQQTLILGNNLNKANANSCLELIGQLQMKRKGFTELGTDSSYIKKEIEECNEAIKLVVKQLDQQNS